MLLQPFGVMVSSSDQTQQAPVMFFLLYITLKGLLQVSDSWNPFTFGHAINIDLSVNCSGTKVAVLIFLSYTMMLGAKSILPPTDIHELLRCYATFAILKTFGFADFPWKSLHPHVFAGPKLKNLIVQARTAFEAFDPGIIL